MKMYLTLSRNVDALDLATTPSLCQIWNALHIVWIRDAYYNEDSNEEIARITQLFARNSQELSGIYSREENP